jgi:hypothetical protein
MVVEKGIPEFRLILSDFVTETSYNPDTVFYYLVETYKGPINKPVIITGTDHGQAVFGVDFSPFFYQNPTGVIGVIRVGTAGQKQASITYTINSGADEVLTVTSKDYGTDKKEFKITPTITGTGKYNVLIKIPSYGTRTYSGLNSIRDVVKRVGDRFSDYFTFEYTAANEPLIAADLDIPGSFILAGGSNGFELDVNAQLTAVEVPENGKFVESHSIDFAYRQALTELETIDLFGIDTLSNSPEVRVALIEHLHQMLEPEVGRERLIVTNAMFHAQLDSVGEPAEFSVQDVIDDARLLNHSHILYLGQGCKFSGPYGEVTLTPTEATMLYAGKRSALQYGEAIGGGESKKVLIGVTDTIPIANDGFILSRQDVVDLNESGVMQFKREYLNNFNEPVTTILEGVTTDQESYELSQESIISIYINVAKRLMRVARPFMQQKLTSDLKATFENALILELQTIKDTDKTLIDMEIPEHEAYKVTVQGIISAQAMPNGRLKRDSKFIARVAIVPVGSLRLIDLGIIVV